jgi:hypothetical protein
MPRFSVYAVTFSNSPPAFADCARNVKKACASGLYIPPMKLKRIRWGLALGGASGAFVVQIAAAFAWVAIYSYALHPGESLAFYQQYALIASPWVSIILGFPVFYLVCRWIGSRSPSRAWPTAMGLFGIYLVIDVPILFFGSNPTMALWLPPISYALKFLGCYFGGRSAARAEIAQPA